MSIVLFFNNSDIHEQHMYVLFRCWNANDFIINVPFLNIIVCLYLHFPPKTTNVVYLLALLLYIQGVI